MPRKPTGVETTVLQLRLPKALVQDAEAIASHCGNNNSLVFRAALRLGLQQLRDTPNLVKAIEAGMLDDPTWKELQSSLKGALQPAEAGAAALTSVATEPDLRARVAKLEKALDALRRLNDPPETKRGSARKVKATSKQA